MKGNAVAYTANFAFQTVQNTNYCSELDLLYYSHCCATQCFQKMFSVCLVLCGSSVLGGVMCMWGYEAKASVNMHWGNAVLVLKYYNHILYLCVSNLLNILTNTLLLRLDHIPHMLPPTPIPYYKGEPVWFCFHVCWATKWKACAVQVQLRCSKLVGQQEHSLTVP